MLTDIKINTNNMETRTSARPTATLPPLQHTPTNRPAASMILLTIVCSSLSESIIVCFICFLQTCGILTEYLLPSTEFRHTYVNNSV